MICELCEMEFDSLTEHHLIPRTHHNNKKIAKLFTPDQMKETIDICRKCHDQIHMFIKEKDMATTYNTLQMLKNHTEVYNYLEWKKKRQYRGN